MVTLGTNLAPERSDPDAYFATDHLKQDLRKRALAGAKVMVIAQALTYTIQTVGTIVLARLLTPDDFGLVAMVIAFSLILQNFGVNGFIDAVIQRKDLSHRQVSTLFWINAFLCLTLMLLFIASAPLISSFYKEPRLQNIVIAIALSIGLAGLSAQHQAVLTRNMQFKRSSAIEIGSALLSFACAIILALRGWGYWALVAKWVVAPFITTVGVWALCGWRPGLPSRGTGVKPILKYAISSSGNFFLGYLSRTIDKILIGRFHGGQSLGYYDRAYYLSSMIPLVVLLPLSKVALATFSRMTDDFERYRYNYLKMISFLAFITMLFSVVTTITATDIVVLLMGSHWSSSGLILTVLGPSIGVGILYRTNGWLHLSLGTPERWFRWSVVAFCVTAIMLFAGVQYGAIGVAVAYSASFFVLLAPGLWYAGRPIELKFSSILSVTWRYFVCAFAATLLCWYILYLNKPASGLFSGLNIFLRIIASTGLCTSLYLAMIIVLYQSISPITDFYTILREIIQKGGRPG